MRKPCEVFTTLTSNKCLHRFNCFMWGVLSSILYTMEYISLILHKTEIWKKEKKFWANQTPILIKSTFLLWFWFSNIQFMMWSEIDFDIKSLQKQNSECCVWIRSRQNISTLSKHFILILVPNKVSSEMTRQQRKVWFQLSKIFLMENCLG